MQTCEWFHVRTKWYIIVICDRNTLGLIESTIWLIVSVCLSLFMSEMKKQGFSPHFEQTNFITLNKFWLTLFVHVSPPFIRHFVGQLININCYVGVVEHVLFIHICTTSACTPLVHRRLLQLLVAAILRCQKSFCIAFFLSDFSLSYQWRPSVICVPNQNPALNTEIFIAHFLFNHSIRVHPWINQ